MLLRETLPERRITDMNALLMGAQILLRKEEFAGSTEQKSNNMNALLMDAQIKFTKEECARSMGQNINDATEKDVQINLTKEEYV